MNEDIDLTYLKFAMSIVYPKMHICMKIRKKLDSNSFCSNGLTNETLFSDPPKVSVVSSADTVIEGDNQEQQMHNCIYGNTKHFFLLMFFLPEFRGVCG